MPSGIERQREVLHNCYAKQHRMLAAHDPAHLLVESSIRGGTKPSFFTKLGVPPPFIGHCRMANWTLANRERFDALRTGQHPVLDPYHREPITVFTGVLATEHAVAAMAAVFMGNRCRPEGVQPLGRPVAGPPMGLTHLGVARTLPVDLVQTLFHVTSPLCGVRPLNGPDDPSNVDVGIGTLAILGIASPEELERHWPKVLLCIRRRNLEGLPTFLAISSSDIRGLEDIFLGITVQMEE